MKKIILIPLSLLCILMQSGCWDRIEINDLAIITAVAFDKASEKEIELSAQVFIPRSFSGGTASSSSNKSPVTLSRTTKGVNVADALSKMQANLPRKVFWGHCKIYIYGEELAKEGITELVDFLTRHPEPRNRAYMYVSKGKAKEMLSLTPTLEINSAEVVRKLSGLDVGMKVTLLELQKMLEGNEKTAVLPMISIMKPEKAAQPMKTNPYLIGTAVFKDGKMSGLLSERYTRGAMWIRNEIASTTVTVKAKSVRGFVSLNPIREVTKLIPKIENGKWKMLVEVETEGDLIQNGTNLDLTVPKLMKIMENALRDDIETRIKGTLAMAQKELKADIFDFATHFRRKYPREFAAVKDKWEQVFPKVEVEVVVKAYIRRPGLSTIPGGIPESEVRKK
ncbi:spore germination protein KC [Brevibacillus reuszeri]|uniref:Spore germination protein KC n=1 Tax=Brevibacillus reuszeri TaxID=54915 RepID=A0A0K9YNT3_9BACL|nr:Ger(x)C family spore germination protein [Brevibacillus reuszeri]KNB70378.1 spore gernimation protein GerC [Brevibacillus reuszeri]MED1857908.1 Ger(x)C family spore germination protein [Brevibacillus reuszeri]GED71774.1 spore germination protein KC [Brevibacillus reuszeri]